MRFWAVRFPLRFPDPLLPPDDPTPPPGGPPPSAPKKIVCEFCACVLAPSGDYVSLSERAKGLRAQEETIAGLNDQIRELVAERDAAIQRQADAEARAAALEREKNSKKGFWNREVGA